MFTQVLHLYNIALVLLCVEKQLILSSCSAQARPANRPPQKLYDPTHTDMMYGTSRDAYRYSCSVSVFTEPQSISFFNDGRCDGVAALL